MSSDIRFDPYAVELDEGKRKELINNLAEPITSRGMGPAAIFLLEMTKPLTWIGTQFAYGFAPFFVAFIKEELFFEYTKLFSDRENVEALIQRIEALMDEMEREKKRKQEGKGWKERILSGFRGHKKALDKKGEKGK